MKSAIRVAWSIQRPQGSKLRSDPRVKSSDLLAIAQEFGGPFRLRDLVRFPTVYAKAWDWLIEDGKIRCIDERQRLFAIA